MEVKSVVHGFGRGSAVVLAVISADTTDCHFDDIHRFVAAVTVRTERTVIFVLYLEYFLNTDCIKNRTHVFLRFPSTKNLSYE